LSAILPDTLGQRFIPLVSDEPGDE